MTTPTPEVKEFLDKSRQILEPKSVLDEFAEVLRQETTRQIKEQLAHDFEPLLSRLATIEKQQVTIIELLKQKLNFDIYEKEIYDLVKTKIEKE